MPEQSPLLAYREELPLRALTGRINVVQPMLCRSRLIEVAPTQAITPTVTDELAGLAGRSNWKR
jgi:hypothetical protein